MVKNIKVTMTFPSELLEEVDKRRGDIKRSTYMATIIKKSLRRGRA